MARRLSEILEGLFGAGSAASPEPDERRCPACDTLLYREEGAPRGVVRCLGCDARWRWNGRAERWERLKR